MTRRIVPAVALLASALLALFSAVAIAAPPASHTESSKPRHYPKYREGEVLVRLRDHTNVDEERRLRERHGLTLIQDLRTIRVRRYRVPPGRSVEEAVERLSKDPSVEFAQPNGVYWIKGCPQDPIFVDKRPEPNQWGLFATRIPYLWRNGDSGAGTLIAIVDTGAELTHPDLAANLWTNPGEIPGDGLDNDQNGFIDDVNGWNFVGVGGNDVTDEIGHGTMVAGIACAAANSTGMAGVAYGAHFIPLKVTRPDGTTDDGMLAQAIQYAAYQRVQVINISIGGPDPPNRVLREAVDAADIADCVIVAAAGYYEPPQSPDMDWPAAMAKVISVGSVDALMHVAPTSPYGGNLVLVAPGVEIWSANLNDGYFQDSGTSYAAPLVSGICAILLQHFPTMKPREVWSYLIHHTRDTDGLAAGQAGNTDGSGVISFGSLRDYSNGGLAAAWSLNSFFEWLGEGVTGESSLNDNLAVGMNDGDDYLPDLDGVSNSMLRGDDGYDDGLFPLSHVTLPWLPTHLNPSPPPLGVQLEVCDHLGWRYYHAEALGVRAWADWNSSGVLADPGERLLDSTSVPIAWPADQHVLVTPMITNENHFRGNPLRVRTRLYGTNTPAGGPTGPQNFGEVEDQTVLNFVEPFDTTFYAPPRVPFADLGTGWRIIADDPPGFPYVDPPPHHNQWLYAFNNRQTPCPNPETGRLTMPEASQPKLDLRELTDVRLQLWALHTTFQCATCDPSWQDNCRLIVQQWDSLGVFVGQTTLFEFPEINDAICGGAGPWSGVLNFDLSSYAGGYIRIAVDHTIVNIYDSLVIDDVMIWGYDEVRPAPTTYLSSDFAASGIVTVDWTHPKDNSIPTPSDPNMSLYQARLYAPGDTWATAWRLLPNDFTGIGSIPPPPGTANTTYSNMFRAPTVFMGFEYALVPQDEVSWEPASWGLLSLEQPLLSYNPTITPMQPSVIQGIPGSATELAFVSANASVADDDVAGVAFDRKGWLSGSLSWSHWLAAGEADTDTVVVTIPFSAVPTDTDSVFVVIRSLSDPSVTATSLTRIVLPATTGVPDAPLDLPTRVALSMPRPNPFRTDTQIELAMPRAGRAEVDVYDVVGRRVRALISGDVPPGRHVLRWDGRGEAGAQLGAGMYFVRARALGETQMVRMLFMP
jgi:subtilisin family serine protease